MNPYTVKNYMWAVIVVLFVAIACLSGCSTIDGVGKDISSTAQWTKEKMGGSK